MSVDHDSVDLVGDQIATRIAYAAAVAALTAGLSYIALPYPLSPAPVTLQVLGVFLAGVFLGPIWGAGAIGLYVVVGALGVPVFAQGSAGLGVIRGPTGGYLLAFPVAAGITGLAVHRGRKLLDPATVPLRWYAVGLTAGMAVIYALGPLWMGAVLDLSLREAFITGAAVFFPADTAKAIAAVIAARSGLVSPPTES